LIAFVLALIPASSYAGVFISINIAPPVLPVYEQPPCPEIGYMWTPGYWAYGPDGYYWVPGAWVPAPEPGLLWTPPYWGFEGGAYLFHAGYWGPHVGYYGGVNYGFGYMGMGFAGGEWRGRNFFYNTAVMRVGGGGGWGGRTYVNQTIVHNTTIINNNRVAYSGGPHGINHPPSVQERRFSNERHTAPTTMQRQHIQAASRNPEQRFNANHGRPATVVSARPVGGGQHNASAIRGGEAGRNNGAAGHNQPGARPENTRPENNRQMTAPHTQPNQINRNAERPVTPSARPQSGVRPQTDRRPNESRPSSAVRPAPAARPESPRPEARPAQPAARPESRPAPRPESRPAARPESRPAPAPRPAPSHPESHPHR
jgi:hypothetical protein